MNESTQKDQGVTRDVLVRRLTAVLFVSGFCSLVFQVAWFRLARQVFGASTASTSAVVAIFMGGLGLGAALFGRRVARTANPLNLYAKLEAGIALTAALTPLTMGLAQWTYVSLGGAHTLGASGALVMRLLLATLVLGVPTTLMGGTLPVMAQALEVKRDRGRRLVARLYGVNTLGAVTGAVVATFAAIEFLGIRQTIWLAALVNLLLPVVVRSLARQTERPGDETTGDVAVGDVAAGDGTQDARARPDVAQNQPETAPGRATGEQSEAAALPIPVILAISAVVGFVFFLMELVWYRTLAPLLGGTSYTFGLILAIALLGIGAGSVAYSLGQRKRRPSVGGLALALVLEGFFLVVPFALGDYLAFFTAVIRHLSAAGFAGLILSWAIVASIVVLPAATIAGYQFPLLVGLIGSGAKKVGHHVGRVYAWNTWGSIFGSLAGGFGLLPLLGAVRLWWLCAALLAVAGLALSLVGSGGRRKIALPAISLALATLFLCSAEGPTAFWRQTPIGAGRFLELSRTPNSFKQAINQRRRYLLVETEGVESNVALVSSSQLALLVNSKSDGAAVSDAPTVIMSGLIGALLHPSPRRALVIGLGTGSTAGWFAAVETIEAVDVVELEPAVIDLLPFFAAVNLDAHESPKIQLSSGDGREHVLTTGETYDVIFSEPSNPYRAGVADLFSQDFYRGIERRLAPDGIFLQWLQLYEVDAEVLQTAFATLTSVFPSVETWLVNSGDLLLVASREPLKHDAARLREKVRQEPFRSALYQTWGVEGLEGLYSGYLAGPKLAATLATSTTARISTDDRPLIEFGFVRNLGSNKAVGMDVARSAQELGATRPPIAEGALSWSLVEELREVRALRSTYPAAAPLAQDDPSRDAQSRAGQLQGAQPQAGRAIRAAARRAFAAGRAEDALELWRQQASGPLCKLDRLLIGEGMATLGEPDAEAHLQRLKDHAPVEGELFHALWLMRHERPDEAIERLVAGLRVLRSNPWVDQAVVIRSFELVKQLSASSPERARTFLDLLGQPFAVFLLNEHRRERHLEVALATADPKLCADSFEAFEPHVIWQEPFLRGREHCYRASGHRLASRAAADLATFLAHSAPVLDLPTSGSPTSE